MCKYVMLLKCECTFDCLGASSCSHSCRHLGCGASHPGAEQCVHALAYQSYAWRMENVCLIALLMAWWYAASQSETDTRLL